MMIAVVIFKYSFQILFFHYRYMRGAVDGREILIGGAAVLMILKQWRFSGPNNRPLINLCLDVLVLMIR
jgi:hypothetical protein